MEKMTCKEAVQLIIETTDDIGDLKLHYPELMSVEDLCGRDEIDAHHANDDYIRIGGGSVFLTDACDNYDTIYEI